jgi:sec-independent protein translocase protein TatB
MSLPDTVFIFVLALIIFGPKKLPEIGRQLGRLVGEFRRASNEFKFQIEEELRQVDFNDKRNSQQTLAAPINDTAQIADTSAVPIFPQDSEDPAENIAVGQHPNIDTLDTSELNSYEASHPLVYDDTNLATTNSEAAGGIEEKVGGEVPTVPTITAAAGTQARTTVPYAASEPATNSVSSPPENPAPAEAEITHG